METKAIEAIRESGGQLGMKDCYALAAFFAERADKLKREERTRIEAEHARKVKDMKAEEARKQKELDAEYDAKLAEYAIEPKKRRAKRVAKVELVRKAG